jgi:hypothetical protein
MGAQRRPPDDRIAALKAFHARDIFTWVSLEPTLDIEASLAIVEATHGFGDLYKVGRVNYLPMTKTTDWRDYTLRMLDTLNRVGARHYIKKDLQSFHLVIRIRCVCHNTIKVSGSRNNAPFFYYTSSHLAGACADRPERLDWIPQRDDPQVPQCAERLRVPTRATGAH